MSEREAVAERPYAEPSVEFEDVDVDAPQVGIVMGSKSDMGGLSAALPGVVAAHSDLPVIGVPLTSRTSVAGGLDALLSITQMPPGVPVACVGVDSARNAAVLAARILSA